MRDHPPAQNQQGQPEQGQAGAQLDLPGQESGARQQGRQTGAHRAAEADRRQARQLLQEALLRRAAGAHLEVPGQRGPGSGCFQRRYLEA